MGNTSKVHICKAPGCDMSFDRPYKLMQHMLLHQNVRNFTCAEDNCTKAYSSQSHLNRHIQSTHKENKNDKIYSCPSCLRSFVNRQNLKRHMSKCPADPKSQRFHCDTCNLEFKNKNQLVVHMYRHTGVKAFSCDLCTENFITPYDLRRHLRFHKSYTCDICFKNFNHWSSFKEHKKTHSECEYICDICKKSFKKRDDIVRHMKSHYELKTETYECHYFNCTREYAKKSSLIHHMRVKHQNLRFNCTICAASLASKARLQSHMQCHMNPSSVSRPPPKTLATGRKERKDKGISKGSTALQIVGLPQDLKSVEDASDNGIKNVSNI